MWSDNKSLVLSKIFVGLFMALLVGSIIFLPSIYGRYLYIATAALSTEFQVQVIFFRITVYAGAMPAGAILLLLHNLLNRIGKAELFTKKNVDCLRHISWCCFIGALICLVSALYWLPWGAVGVAAAFMGLIVRVLKNVVSKAVSLQDDADLTV